MVHGACLENMCAQARVGSNPTSSASRRLALAVRRLVCYMMGFEQADPATAGEPGPKAEPAGEDLRRIPPPPVSIFGIKKAGFPKGNCPANI